MELNRDFSEFIAFCIAHSVRFLIVGGYAVAAHRHPRFTKDLDVWVWVDERNADHSSERSLTSDLARSGWNGRTSWRRRPDPRETRGQPS